MPGTDMNITNDLVTEYLNRYYRPACDDLAKLRRTAEADRVPIILPETEIYLNSLLLILRPEKILEIGTAIGYSALYFAYRCPQAQIYTIEKDETAVCAARHNFRISGKEEQIRCFLGDGQEQIEKLRDNGVCDFDFIFIDGAKSHYRRFLDAALSISKPGTIIVSDNILQKAMTVSDTYDSGHKHKTNIKKMRQYIDYICSAPELTTSLLSVGDGIAVTMYRGKNGSETF